MSEPSNHPDRIADFFTNKTLLVTGGTGFVGKVFLEKLLRACPNLKKIYLLVRPKKGRNPNERIKDIFNGPLFELLKNQRGDDIVKKVEAVDADMEAEDLGLSHHDFQKLAEEVEMVYHCAATVRYDETLKKTILLNTRATKLMLDLAKKCKKLVLFVYLSTAYCHLKERVLYEKAYPPPASPRRVIDICEWLDEKVLDAITSDILGDLPNCYAFSKALGEGLVNDEMDNLPVIILRPSVIVPAWKEPLPGWTDNLNGPMGLLSAAGKGVLRTMYCNSETYLDYVPVDLVANALLIFSFLHLQTNQRVFNITGSSQYKTSFKEVIEIGQKIVENEIPFNGVLWYPGGSLNKYRWQHNLEFFFLQLVPAVFLDGLLVVLGYPPVLLKVQKRIYKGYEVLGYYVNRQWDFYNEGTLNLVKSLNPREQATYKLDSDGFDVNSYLIEAIHCIRKYIFKEGDETIAAAKRHMRVMWFVDKITKILMVIGLVYYLYRRFGSF